LSGTVTASARADRSRACRRRDRAARERASVDGCRAPAATSRTPQRPRSVASATGPAAAQEPRWISSVTAAVCSIGGQRLDRSTSFRPYPRGIRLSRRSRRATGPEAAPRSADGGASRLSDDRVQVYLWMAP
jgi:hypothetical protein